MPLTTLDPTPALVLIDLQKGVVGMPCAHPMQEIVSRAAQLAKAFRQRGFPVVLVNVTGRPPGRIEAELNMQLPPDWTELVPELEASPTDHRISKQRWGAFIGTDLDSYLRSKGATQIFLAGVATSIGVESTARCAYELGYNVVFASDAMTDRVAEAHQVSMERIFPRLGEKETTDKILESVLQ